MSDAFEHLQQCLKKLPGLGYRSAERLALHLLVENPSSSDELIDSLKRARSNVRACPVCGNLCEDSVCAICADHSRDRSVICVIETVTDLRSMERAGAYRGLYHVLQGKLSPIHGIGPEQINLASLEKRIADEAVNELILALPNDIEGEATCHYIQEELVGACEISVSRIGFGLPSGGGIPYADSTTLRSALEGRRKFD